MVVDVVVVAVQDVVVHPAERLCAITAALKATSDRSAVVVNVNFVKAAGLVRGQQLRSSTRTSCLTGVSAPSTTCSA